MRLGSILAASLVAMGLLPLVLGGCAYQGYSFSKYAAEARTLAEKGHNPRVPVKVRRSGSRDPLEARYANYSRIQWGEKANTKGHLDVQVVNYQAPLFYLAAPFVIWGVLGLTGIIFQDDPNGKPLPWWVWGGVGSAAVAGGLVALGVVFDPFSGSGPKVPQAKQKRSQAYGIHTTFVW